VAAADDDRPRADGHGGQVRAWPGKPADDGRTRTGDLLDRADGHEVAASEYEESTAGYGSCRIVDRRVELAGLHQMPGRRVDRQDAPQAAVAREAARQDDRLVHRQMRQLGSSEPGGRRRAGSPRPRRPGPALRAGVEADVDGALVAGSRVDDAPAVGGPVTAGLVEGELEQAEAPRIKRLRSRFLSRACEAIDAA